MRKWRSSRAILTSTLRKQARLGPYSTAQELAEECSEELHTHLWDLGRERIVLETSEAGPCLAHYSQPFFVFHRAMFWNVSIGKSEYAASSGDSPLRLQVGRLKDAATYIVGNTAMRSTIQLLHVGKWFHGQVWKTWLQSWLQNFLVHALLLLTLLYNVVLHFR